MSYDRREGEILEVTLRDVRVTDVLSTGFRGVSSFGVTSSTRTYAEMNEIYFPDKAVIIGSAAGGRTGVSIKPKPGDVYRANGKVWYVREFQGRTGTVIIEDGNGNSYSDDRMNLKNEIREFEFMNPVLIIRDGKAV